MDNNILILRWYSVAQMVVEIFHTGKNLSCINWKSGRFY